MTPKDAIRGRCLCGAVTFTLTPPTEFCAHCHCQSCRLAHGAACTTWTSVPRDRFQVTGGDQHIRWYRSSQWIRWGFCDTCGSSMFYVADSEGHPESPRTHSVYVTVGSLIDPMDRPPSGHYSYEEHMEFDKAHDRLPCFLGKTHQTIDA